MPLYDIPLSQDEVIETMNKAKNRVASPIFVDANRDVHISRINMIIAAAVTNKEPYSESIVRGEN